MKRVVNNLKSKGKIGQHWNWSFLTPNVEKIGYLQFFEFSFYGPQQQPNILIQISLAIDEKQEFEESSAQQKAFQFKYGMERMGFCKQHTDYYFWQEAKYHFCFISKKKVGINENLKLWRKKSRRLSKLQYYNFF